jgi:hypothetical protein
MSIENQRALEADFPDPAEQAEALLELCEGDICEAELIADTNLKFANDEGERRYWSRVKHEIVKQDSTTASRLDQ